MIEATQAYMLGGTHKCPESLRDADRIDKELRRVLAGHDPFWPRWVVWTERQGGEG